MFVSALDALDHEDVVISAVASWLDTYVSRPDPLSARASPMCIRSRVAIDQGEILLARRDTPCRNEIGYMREIVQIGESFRGTIEREPTRTESFSILFCYDHVDLKLFEEACRSQKAAFLTAKLLLGKFHPEIKLHALNDSNHWFKPAPYPILALRQLIKADIRFLTNNRNVADRADLVSIYKDAFGDYR